jgi:recombination protein RecR
MAKLAKPLQDVIDAFERLPGIGPKTAQRMGFYMLHVPQYELDAFASAMTNLKKNTVECSTCYNIAESNPCPVCADLNRDTSIICVVEQPIDILAVEKVDSYRGLYHVLHGRIDPLNNIRPEDIRIEQLVNRIKSANQQANNSAIQEIILALNPDMEGEATAMYISKRLIANQQSTTNNSQLTITRLAHGLPTGASIEYADATTLGRAFEGRRAY